MEQDQIQAETPSYWPSVIIGALVVTIVTSVILTSYLYYLAGAEPSMGLLIKSGLMLPLSCLFGLIGGVISTRHYAKTNEITFAIGKGAQIGFLTGLVAAVFGIVLSQLWQFIDPALMDNFANNLIDAMGSANMPEAQYNEAVDKMRADFANQQTFVGILKGGAINVLVLGAVNAISGMIGAKIYASPKEEEIQRTLNARGLHQFGTAPRKGKLLHRQRTPPLMDRTKRLPPLGDVYRLVHHRLYRV